ncbi:MAG: hypothetical protein EOP04_04275 [Proteobacteria bacterium]|nr:MAG: hypothetical protein EOP04_04275 [Pseudomonadota bacterium]
MEFNSELLHSLIVGATGGIPMTVLLVQIVGDLKGKIEILTSRLQKLEVVFEVHFQSEIKRLNDKQDKLESKITSIETAVNRLQL